MLEPLPLRVEFKYGLGGMTELKSLELHPITDATPLKFTFTVGPFGYKVMIEPKTGFSWGTARQVGDLRIVAVEAEPPQPDPGQGGHTAVPVGM